MAFFIAQIQKIITDKFASCSCSFYIFSIKMTTTGVKESFAQKQKRLFNQQNF